MSLPEAKVAVPPGLSIDLRALAFVSPGWPPDQYCNGIVSYTERMRSALLRRGVRIFVLAYRGKVADCSSQADVEILDHSSPDVGLVRRFLRKAAWTVMPEQAAAAEMARAVLSRVIRLHREAGLELLQMEESFGRPDWIVPHSPVPVVVRLHGPWFLNGPAAGVSQDAAFARRVRREGKAIAAAAGVSAPSLDVLDRVRDYYGLPLADAVVIPNPIPPPPPDQRWARSACEPDRVLFVGRFDNHKGGDVMIEAFARLLAARPTARLTFVGPDNGCIDSRGRGVGLREFADSRLGAAAHDGRFEWLGKMAPEQIVHLRRRAAVTVVPSRYETFGNTLLEALSQGCPAIASAIGGLAEILEHERTGLLCRAGDPADLAASLGRLLDEPALAERLGRQAAAHCERRHAPDAIAAETAAFHREVIERWKRPRLKYR